MVMNELFQTRDTDTVTGSTPSLIVACSLHGTMSADFEADCRCLPDSTSASSLQSPTSETTWTPDRLDFPHTLSTLVSEVRLMLSNMLIT